MRAGEWWEYKLLPIFSLFYATAVVLDVPIASLWRAAIVVLLALVPGAAYVSVINDITDREEDRAAGKRNRVEGKSPLIIAALVAITVVPGFVFSWLWHDDVLLLSAYLAAWLAFSLYSLRPFRFKSRGIFGVLCDASGAHLFPSLVAVLLVFREAHRPRLMPWLIAVALWSFTYGLRGILWHQLTDRDNDQHAGVRTFAQRHAPHVAERMVKWLTFPLELAALAALLWQVRSPWPLASLAVYALLSVRRVRLWQMNAIIVAPRPRFFVVLHEYYDVFLPLALLLTAALRHPIDLAVIAVHLVLFPARALQTFRDVRRIRPRVFGH